MTVVEKLFENAARHPNRLAVVFEGEEVTYGQLRDAVIRLASWLTLHGVGRGDRVAVQAQYGKWYIAAYYAAHLVGAAVVPLEKTLTRETLRATVERMEARAAVTWLEPAAPVSLNYRDAEAELAGVEIQPYTFPDMDLVANIMLTSGTTGTPKAAMLTQRNLAVNCVVRIKELEISPDDMAITFLPLNHVGCSRMVDTALYNGSSYILLDGIFKIKTFFEFMEKYRVTSFNMPPSGLATLEALSHDKLHDFADQIKLAYIHASLMQEPQRAFLKRVLPKSRRLYAYGTSENGTVSVLRLHQYEKDVRCVGQLCEGVEVCILDDEMNQLPNGQQGRVAIRTEMNFKGYWGMPERTKAVYNGDWFLTNDAGYLDDEGFLYILGRIDDVMNIGGLKVHPSEIENVAAGLDGVEECLCVDVPNAMTGIAAKLLVKKKEESALNIRNIRMALSEKLDSYKIPASIEFVDEIRKNAIGKPDRNFYRETNKIERTENK